MTLEQACKRLLVKSPFYGLFLLGLNKYYGNKSSTACVCKNGINIELCVNKDFWDTLDDEMQLGVLAHECGHILFKHMFMTDAFPDPHRRNVAADCEVNSYLPVLQKDPYCYAGAFDLQNKQGTKFYYDNLPKDIKTTYIFVDNSPEGDPGGSQSGEGKKKIYVTDDHGNWKEFKDLPEAEKELIQDQIDHMAKETAQQISRMAGKIPGEFKDYIDNLLKPRPAVFNWKAYFRRLMGTAIETSAKKTRRKESVRFEGAAGIKQKHKHNILVGIDTSGSVSDDELRDFFTEINHIYKSGAGIEILEFDHAIQNNYRYTGKWDGKISGRGGTSFHEPIQWFNERRNAYSAFVLFTDGYADTDGLRPMKEMIWVITSEGNRDNKYPGKTVFIPKIEK